MATYFSLQRLPGQPSGLRPDYICYASAHLESSSRCLHPCCHLDRHDSWRWIIVVQGCHRGVWHFPRWILSQHVVPGLKAWRPYHERCRQGDLHCFPYCRRIPVVSEPLHSTLWTDRMYVICRSNRCRPWHRLLQPCRSQGVLATHLE